MVTNTGVSFAGSNWDTRRFDCAAVFFDKGAYKIPAPSGHSPMRLCGPEELGREASPKRELHNKLAKGGHFAAGNSPSFY